MKLKIITLIQLISIIFAIQVFSKNINDTLFFVGEDTDVITIASGRPENPEKAPASNRIYKDFSIHSNFEDLIKKIPGFYIDDTNQRTKLYFRGIPDSLLFLYDGVPITSDLTRSVVPLRDELPFYNISKIEVVYGASSVLWGADAFAGVMNSVLKKGSEINGLNISATNNTFNRDRSFYVEGGKIFNKLDAMFSIYYKDLEKKFKTDYADKSYDFDFATKLIYNNELNFTLRLSNNKNKYINSYKDNLWDSEDNKPFNLLKAEYNKKFIHSSINIKTYYLDMDFTSKENGFNIKQRNKVYYGGIIYNRDLFNNSAMITVGYNYRKNKIENSDAVIRSFIPDYVINKSSFYPLIDKVSVSTYLNSYFLQFRKHFKFFETWAGYRKDFHSKYDNTDSFNLGVGYFKNRFTFKINYGLSYRTPLPKEFIERSKVIPEKVYNLNIEAKYNNFSIMFFRNRLEDLILENSYTGFSNKLSANIYGIQAETKGDFTKNLSYYINCTFIMNNKLKDEYYKLLDYIIINPDFQIEKFYKTLTKPLDIGAKRFANASLIYKKNNYEIFLTANYTGDRNYYFLPENSKIKISNKVIFNAGLNIKNFKNFRTQIFIENIFNSRFQLPGNYAPEKNKPFNFIIKIGYKF
jgi:outer membrane cobalamin receptor